MTTNCTFFHSEINNTPSIISHIDELIIHKYSENEILQMVDEFVSDFSETEKANIVMKTTHPIYEKYNMKELIKICNYYCIASKNKKQDIIETIVHFEENPKNAFIVNKRRKMWEYMNELNNDPHMKLYVMWNSPVLN